MTAKKKTEKTATNGDVATLAQAPLPVLPSKTVKIVFYAKPTAMVTDPAHILYGGLAPRSGKSFQLPRLRTGAFFNPFPTPEIQAELEALLGMETGGLNPARMQNNFFDNYLITLDKGNISLDLSDPIQYLRYVVAKAQKDFVAPDRASIKNRATYQWFIEDSEVEATRKVLKISTKSEAYKEFGKIENNPGKLRQILVERKGKANLPTAANDLDWLIGAVGEFIEEDPTVFLNLAKDPNLAVKVVIYEAIKFGIIAKKNSFYYDEEGSPLAMPGFQNDIGGAINYITQPENSDYYATVQQRIQNAK